MSEPHDIRLKRLRLRSMRRGIREMDLILSAFAEARLDAMGPADLDLYERLLEENDQLLFAWVTGSEQPAPEYAEMVTSIVHNLPK
ncbi:MAG: succinate dehydrogenase assembly factor 2 [Marinibacterium sp.]